MKARGATALRRFTAVFPLLVLALVVYPNGTDAADCSALVVTNDAFKTTDFDRCEAIAVGDASKGVKVMLLWKISGRGSAAEEVTIAAQFPAGSDKGWVSVGLSETGSMFGSDMTVVRQEKGVFVAEDYYAMASEKPTKDVNQDSKLLKADVSGGRTSIVFVRPTKTCGNSSTSFEDLDFNDVLTAAIVAWGDTHDLGYHQPGQRASAWINFFDNPPEESTAGLQSIVLRGNTLDVPTADSTTYCYSAHILPQDKKYHVVRAEPILNSSHPQHVHHMILYTCLEELDPSFVNKTKDGPPVCAAGMQQKGMCYTFWVLWAAGGRALHMPPEAGMPMGLRAGPQDQTTARNLMLEIHYDNPGKKQIVDSSGFKLYYTDVLRKNDAVIMTLGHLAIDIPAGAEKHQHTNACSSSCTKKLKQPLTVLWAGLHMHSLGKSIWTQHIRGSQELAPLGRKRSWDFNQQSPTHVKAVIQPGDTLVTNCVYSAKSKTTSTRFGEGTSDEMCFNFLMVYPADNILICTSLGSYLPDKALGVCMGGAGADGAGGGGVGGNIGILLGGGRGGGGGGGGGGLELLSSISMPFETTPAGVAPYRDPVCGAKSYLSSKSDAGRLRSNRNSASACLMWAIAALLAFSY